ncbi:Geraniol 8-hydroxylase [Glycine soja]|uniref:Geraniol 8-hydroxylase n=1 Tax=Glycine soja TaxID=3848 RepID=A0A445ISD2_GLYSO|nr:Geraniol 8-hydroxylase [Glycine soja]
MDSASCALLIVLTCAMVHALVGSFLAMATKANHKLPPGPSSFPIIGNLLELGEKPHKSLAKLAKIHGPIISLKLGQITTVVVSSAQMAKEVLLTNDQFLSNRTIPQSVSVLNHEQYSLAFMPISPLWRELRKICNTQLFAHKSLDASQDVRRKIVQQLVTDIHESSQMGEAVDIGTAAFKTTINLLSNTIFSVDLIHSTGKAEEFKDLVTNITKLVGSPNLADFFPVLKLLDPQSREEGKVHNDMLDAMLNISKENKYMDKNMIEHLSHDIFVAGTDTTASTLEWAMTELVRHPHVMSKAKQELEQITSKGNPIEEGDIGKLPYLQAIVKETLRLYPPVPFLLPRKADRDVDIGGYTIPKDAKVLVNMWTICRDPTLWDNPTMFSPDRFLGSDIDVKGRNFELAPYGAGRRICPGLSLANRMLLLMLGSLINSFDWKLGHDIETQDMDMDDKFGITLQKAQPLRIVPLKINN